MLVNPPDHVMIDEETLGLSANSVIASIGLVRFDPMAGVQSVETLRKNSLRVNFDISDSIQQGFEVNGETLKWWMNQSNEARESTFGNKYKTVNVASALQIIIGFLDQSDKVWGNGANYDPVLLDHHAKKMGVRLPYNFRKVRCYRTITQMNRISPSIDLKEDENELIAHDPVDDCIYQIRRLQAVAVSNPTLEWR